MQPIGLARLAHLFEAVLRLELELERHALLLLLLQLLLKGLDDHLRLGRDVAVLVDLRGRDHRGHAIGNRLAFWEVHGADHDVAGDLRHGLTERRP